MTVTIKKRRLTTISVTNDCRVLVNGIQEGITYSNIPQANKEATNLHTRFYPKAKLILL